MNTEEQEVLLSIVKTWNISEAPEYRGFRCANCQQYKNEAWYHWVNSDNFLLPIHLCDDTCELLLENNALQIHTAKQHETERETFGKKYPYSSESIETFQKIISSWNKTEERVLKAFTCDLCNKELDIDSSDGVRKGWHVWWSNNGILTELHFHNNCASPLQIGI